MTAAVSVRGVQKLLSNKSWILRQGIIGVIKRIIGSMRKIIGS